MATQTTPERPKAVTFRGAPMTLIGRELHTGEPAPAFALTTPGMSSLQLNEALDNGSRRALLIVVPSLDTPVCSSETLTFHRRRAELPNDVATYVVSADLPFAQARWAEANNVSGIEFLSDYRNHAFGEAYGVEIKELAILARAIFLIERDGTIGYTELVQDISNEPDYDAALAAAKA